MSNTNNIKNKPIPYLIPFLRPSPSTLPPPDILTPVITRTLESLPKILKELSSLYSSSSADLNYDIYSLNALMQCTRLLAQRFPRYIRALTLKDLERYSKEQLMEVWRGCVDKGDLRRVMLIGESDGFWVGFYVRRVEEEEDVDC